MARAPSLAGVILAAGESTRMQRDKALLAWQGKTFLGAAMESLRPHCQLIIVVAGKNVDSLKPVVFAAGGFLVVNPDTDRGQFSSLQVGLQEVLDRGRDAAIVTLIDRPPAAPATVKSLRDRFLEEVRSGHWAVVPQYGDKHGHPIVIGREMIEAFLLRRLDLPPTVRQQSAQRIADHISAKLQVSEDQKRDVENFLELVVRQFRRSATYR